MSSSMVKQLRLASRVLGRRSVLNTLQSIRQSDLLGGDVHAANEIADVQRAIRRVIKVTRQLDNLMAVHNVKPGKEVA